MVSNGVLTNTDAVQRHSKRKVFYYYDESVGNYHYGIGHPMKPQRIRLTHEIIQKYGMLRRMHVYRPTPLPFEEITNFHHPAYLRYLQGVSDDLKMGWQHRFSERFNIGEDCPPFDGCYDFSTLCAGGSVAAAKRLVRGDCDIAINWSGGLHHAKKSEASGFCYINDAVLAIQELLTTFNRVLYIDIDIHHGDGVEEAFLTTNRVFTLSLHKYGDFFPGTGALFDIGADAGKYHTMNVPLDEGVSDDDYEELFSTIARKLNEYYKPDAVVMQCGADSLAGDRIGVFNLTTKAHGGCVDCVLKFNLPTLLLGGGGYTVRNVSRCWTYETAVALNEKDAISDDLPFNSYYEDFGPDFKLHTKPLNWRNKNTKDNLSRMKVKLFDHMRRMTTYKQPQYENGVKVVHAPTTTTFPVPVAAAFAGVDTAEAEARMQDEADVDVRVSEVERNRFREPLEDIADRAETGYSEEVKSPRRVSVGEVVKPPPGAEVPPHVELMGQKNDVADRPAISIEQMEEDLEPSDDDDDDDDDDDESQSMQESRPRMSLMTDYRRLQQRMSDAEDGVDDATAAAAAANAVAVVADGSVPSSIMTRKENAVKSPTTTTAQQEAPLDLSQHSSVGFRKTTSLSSSESPTTLSSSSVQMSSRRSRRIATAKSSRTPSGGGEQQ